MDGGGRERSWWLDADGDDEDDGDDDDGDDADDDDGDDDNHDNRPVEWKMYEGIITRWRWSIK